MGAICRRLAARLTFFVRFVSFLPAAIILSVGACTTTHPTGTSSCCRAASAWSRAARIHREWSSDEKDGQALIVTAGTAAAAAAVEEAAADAAAVLAFEASGASMAQADIAREDVAGEKMNKKEAKKWQKKHTDPRAGSTPPWTHSVLQLRDDVAAQPLNFSRSNLSSTL